MLPKVIEYSYYSYYGFGYLQNWAANTILRLVTGNEKATIAAMTVPMKIPPILKDPFAFMLGMVGPYFFMLIYLPMLYRTTYFIVSEKELRAREIMRMMGMKDTPYWLSWFLYYTIVNTTMCIPIALIITFGVFTASSGIMLFLFIWLYGQSLFGFILCM